ncbi:hypothetical protein NV379_17430 [Paenibacillus sp. N1-5-1-14]|uniref:prenyltransferase/squalene oxidase repeat-containing protein n=1 Tax=Paenibacillus radicibacter TaxID=2972488 RepID=UPI0021598443|nr:prenyltransferase/squalene oxidase repeat-containing protein [Paenibacillus radicibacter]MCR8644439.1 hypothetical protein [Paenibacillus radicibacter]
MIDSQVLLRAKDFIYKHARLLDRKRYEYHFEGGSSEEVIKVLRAYQNADGGFGNALEPDIRTPHSQPVPTEMAFMVMDEVNHYDQEIVQGIVEYLKNRTLPEGGLPFIFKDASEYPHTPWWAIEDDRQASINPTGSMVGYLYKQNAYKDFVYEDWFKKNEQYTWQYLDQGTPSGFHDGIHLITFLENVPDMLKASQHWSKVDEWLAQAGTIERDPHADGYVHKVLDWSPLATSYARKFVTEEEVQKHLDYLIEQQHEDGGWPISWNAISAATEYEWRGWLTVDRLRTLKSYGVI